MNTAILGFYYGIWGTLAYAAYYLSFLTGGKIIDSLRFQHGYTSVQGFLADRFGRWGTSCYNFVAGVRLVSEVFANLLVIGILFGAAGTESYTLAVLGLAAITLFYSMLGGLHGYTARPGACAEGQSHCHQSPSPGLRRVITAHQNHPHHIQQTASDVNLRA
ncbi:MAG: hypothetical protein ABW116_06410 [Candidatus Sedimenticola sp. 20ELBAFRAG]